MSKKKDVYVWVARDKIGCMGQGSQVAVYPIKPTRNTGIIDDFFYLYSPNCSQKIERRLGALRIKKGQCKKYRLVEVKR